MMKFTVDVEYIIDTGRYQVKESRPFEVPEIAITQPVELDLTFTRVEGEIAVYGAAACYLELNCGRCLDDFENRVSVKIDFIRKFDWENDKDVDLAEELRSGMLLSLPITPLCDEGCKGLCPQCGVNRNKTSCKCKDDKSEFSAFTVLKNIKLN